VSDIQRRIVLRRSISVASASCETILAFVKQPRHAKELRRNMRHIAVGNPSGRRCPGSFPAPTSLNDEQRDLLHRFAELEGDALPAEKGVFEKMKDFFVQ